MNFIKGLVPAVFTPMKEDGSIHLDQISNLVKHFVKDKVTALYVCGSNGEGPSLTVDERMVVTETFIKSAKNRLPIIVNVGHNSLKETQKLAEHAEKIGADAFSAVPPFYFKISSLDNLMECIGEIASAAPNFPFYYYHIPAITGVDFDMVEFLEKGGKNIPNLVGIKYSNFKIFELQACLEFENNKFDILFGSDEMLLSALSVSVKGAVGGTYNFAAPLYNKIIKSFSEGDLDEARKLQMLSVKMVRLQYRYGGLPAFKTTMKFIGLDCGPTRLPFQKLTSEEIVKLEKELVQIGFFDWGRN